MRRVASSSFTRPMGSPKVVSRPLATLMASLASGMVSTKPTGWPLTSATSASSGRTICFSSRARWSNSWSVMGTKPQFFSQAAL